MKFELQRPVFEAVLSRAAAVLSPKDLLPILQNFDITVSPGMLRVVATDLELSVVAKTTLVNCVEPGRTLLPGHRLLAITKSCEDALVNVAVEDDKALITCAGASWSLNLMDYEDYPTVPNVDDATLVAVTRLALINALLKVKGAAAKEGVRPALQMIDVTSGNMRASDGAIFRQVRIAELEPVDIQIPLGAVDDLVKLLKSTESEKVNVGQVEDHLLFIVGGDVFIVTKNNMAYPDVEETILGPARKNAISLVVDRQQLVNGVKRVRVTSDADTKGVTFSLTANKLYLNTRNRYGEKGDQYLDVQYGGKERSLGVNHESLIDALQAVDSPTVTILLGEDTRSRKAPIFIKDGGTVAVLQQLKLNGK
jgi:DNA polymerase-3 subunit beta